ncbi:MAG: KTSC domain-containing protein [Acidobacteria bacterium]|nr:MAG: KTSC domain-containing protein [Acidobacteriota bacterium]
MPRAKKRTNRQRVKSSVIATVGYDAGDRRLEVAFHNGRVYAYLDVPASVYEKLVTAESVGKVFNEEVRPHYKAELVEDAVRV